MVWVQINTFLSWGTLAIMSTIHWRTVTMHFKINYVYSWLKLGNGPCSPVWKSKADLTYRPWMYSGDLDSVFKDGTTLISINDAQWVHKPKKASEGPLSSWAGRGRFCPSLPRVEPASSCSVHTWLGLRQFNNPALRDVPNVMWSNRKKNVSVVVCVTWWRQKVEYPVLPLCQNGFTA